jgi:mono/diheme cytochrome c family protein
MRVVVLIGLYILFLLSCEETPYGDGKMLYEFNCSSCHQEDGRGLGELIPPLAGVEYLAENRDKLPCIIRYGIKDSLLIQGKMYAEEMEGHKNLSDVDITNVLNYICNSWGNKMEPYQLGQVKSLLESCEKSSK